LLTHCILSAAWSRGLKRRFYGDCVIMFVRSRLNPHPRRAALLRPWIMRFTTIIFAW